jgi:queuine tRNA-ribosyltransferase/7-cyano-7-deazaguanine tRNA-ribosyltransferase
MLISNTYHLHLQPGEKIVKDAGGLNKFMNWPRPTMTDSGGFQVFSLGFGRDMGVGKFENPFPTKLDRAIESGVQPTSVKITEEGVHFRSPTTGKELFLGPKESMAIQGKLGADIIFAFDECTPPRVTYDYMKTSLALTHRWAKRSLEARKSKQALYGIVQGSVYKDLRQESARYINSLDFEGFGIGGDLGDSINHVASGKPIKNGGTRAVLDWTLPLLDERKPRHLLGIGHLGDIENIIKCGVDTFDCTVPTHYARRGIAFTSKGRVDFRKELLLKDKNPIDRTCECLVCQKYRRDYIAHLIRANEITGGALITFHNLFFFNTYVEKIREKIRKGLI